MKIALVTHAFPPDGITGVERIAQELARDLVRAGDEVTVVTRRLTTREVTSDEERLDDGTAVVRIDGPWDPMRPLAHDREVEMEVAAALERSGAEVVHVLSAFRYPPSIIGAAHDRGARVVVTVLDHWFACPLLHLRKRTGEACAGPDGGRECARTCFADDPDPSRWEQRAASFLGWLRQADVVVAPSAHMARFFAAHGVPSDRLRLVEHGITPPPPVTATPALDGQLRIAVPGAVTPPKGLHVLLEALRLADGVAPVDVVAFGVVHDVAYARALRKRARAMRGVTLRLYGPYEPDELPALLGSFDVVVVPTLLPESFGRTTREAIALGLPVLAAARGALPEAVEHGRNGLLFDPDRPAELAELLVELRREPGLLEALRTGAAATRIRTSDGFAAETRAVYTSALTEGAARDERRSVP